MGICSHAQGGQLSTGIPLLTHHLFFLLIRGYGVGGDVKGESWLHHQAIRIEQQTYSVNGMGPKKTLGWTDVP